MLVNGMASEESSQPDQPVKSIEGDALTDEKWKGMTEVLTAIYDYREPE
jgi:hypothetical protein